MQMREFLVSDMPKYFYENAMPCMCFGFMQGKVILYNLGMISHDRRILGGI